MRLGAGTKESNLDMVAENPTGLHISPYSWKRRCMELLLLSAALGLSFLVINFLHFQFLTVKVILYACILDAFLASVIVLLVYWFVWRPKSALLISEVVLVSIASNLLILLYAVMGPTVIDRSLSLYIVEKLDQRGGQISEEAMADIFVREYLPEFRLVDVRLTEQVASGTAKIENGCVILTEKGRQLSAFVSFYRRVFLPKKRYLRGEVTDQLTKPFDNSESIVDARCN